MGKSIPRTLEGILSRTITTENGCMEWRGHGRRKPWRPQLDDRDVGRIVLELLGHDMSNLKILACHTCDNPRCVNPDHLFPGTSKENTQDYWNKVKSGRRLTRKSPDWTYEKRFELKD